MLLVPGLNDGWVAAGRAYRERLAPAGAGAGAAVPFRLVTLEAAVAALAAAPGGEGPAAYLAERYLAFGRVHWLVLGDDLPPLPGPGRGDAVTRAGSPEPRAGARRPGGPRDAGALGAGWTRVRAPSGGRVREGGSMGTRPVIPRAAVADASPSPAESEVDAVLQAWAVHGLIRGDPAMPLRLRALLVL